MSYVKEIFNPTDLQHAKDIVLSPDDSDPNKFEEDTAFFVDFIRLQNIISSESLVLDFGCGMGRIAKETLDTFQCKVIGTDISPRMLMFAEQYVNHPRLFEVKPRHGQCTIDVIIASLVLQHVEHPRKEIKHLHSILKQGGFLVLFNDTKRFVPVGIDKDMFVIWRDDGINIADIMSDFFENIGYYGYRNRADKPISVWRKAIHV